MITKQSFFPGLIVLLCLWTAPLSAQYGGVGPAPAHDICGKAKAIAINEIFTGESNLNATVSHQMEAPKTWPETCIPTLENDLWYKFQTEEGYRHYTITIAHQGCMTPAGLQALLIRADGCSAEKFEYVGCSSQMTEDSIKLFLEQPMPGLSYLIYVDGYDGCICDFSIELRASQKQPSQRDRYKFTRYFYDAPDGPLYEPLALTHRFLNNRLTLEWTASNEDDVDFFAIQQETEPGSRDWKIVGLLNSRDRVAGGDIPYQWTDFRTIFEEKEYSYRIVKVNGEGLETFTHSLRFLADLITTFHVGEIGRGEIPGSYAVPYINHKKKQDFELTVKNDAGEIVKEMRMEKEPKREGIITINMQDFPPGMYRFRMGNGSDYFEKEFVVD